MAAESQSRLSSSASNGVRASEAKRDDTPDDNAQIISLKEQARSAHEEARMVLPGIQALFGFQLIAVFNRPFFDLGSNERMVHLASLVLVAVAIGLIMAPAAYHRMVERDRVSRYWIRLASRNIACAMAALMLAIPADLYLVAIMITQNLPIAVGLAIAGGIFLGWLWFALPLLRRHREHETGGRVLAQAKNEGQT